MDKKRLRRILDWLAMVLVFVGFVMLCQPFALVIYSYGFTVVLAGVVLLNVAGHM